MRTMLRTSAAITRFKEDRRLGMDVMKAICQDAAEGVGAELVSIWSLNSQQDRIKCQFAFDANASDDLPSGAIILRTTSPSYFDAVTQHSGIIANDVTASPATRELVESYFSVYGIKSLLDFILRKDGIPTGVICCESRNLQSWGDDELGYLRGLATLASYHFMLDDE